MSCTYTNLPKNTLRYVNLGKILKIKFGEDLEFTLFGLSFKSPNKKDLTTGKSTHFFGQPIYGQLIKSLNRDKIVEMSRKNGGEKYIKSFDGYTHLLTMLYAVIMRFDSLR